MPAYDYSCNECDMIFEVIKAMSDDSEVIHSKCGSKNVQRIFSPLAYNKNQGKSNLVVDRDKSGNPKAEVTQHWDGRQDVKIHAKNVETKFGLVSQDNDSNN